MPYIGYYSAFEPKSWFRTIVMPDKTSKEERAFRRYFQRRTLPMAQVAVLMAMVLILAVCILDWIAMPAEFALPAIALRLSTMLLILVGIFVASLIWPTDPRLPYAFMVGGALNGVATIVVGAFAAQSGAAFTAWGTIFVTFYVYLVLGLRFRQATTAGWPVFLTYLTFGIIYSAPMEKIAYGSLFLIFANLIGMYAAFLFEMDSRELYQKKMQLRKLARTDGLTGVNNRRTFDQHLEKVWRQARRESQSVAVLLVDIDHFKLYNDCYGHGPGDECIKAVANALDHTANRPFDMVARYGGEEFAIVLYNPMDRFVRDYANELVRKVSDLEFEHKGSGTADVVTISIGAAIMYPDESNQPDQLVRAADDALYEAKDNGRNRATVYQSDGNLYATAAFNTIAL